MKPAENQAEHSELPCWHMHIVHRAKNFKDKLCARVYANTLSQHFPLSRSCLDEVRSHTLPPNKQLLTRWKLQADRRKPSKPIWQSVHFYNICPGGGIPFWPALVPKSRCPAVPIKVCICWSRCPAVPLYKVCISWRRCPAVPLKAV